MRQTPKSQSDACVVCLCCDRFQFKLAGALLPAVCVCTGPVMWSGSQFYRQNKSFRLIFKIKSTLLLRQIVFHPAVVYFIYIPLFTQKNMKLFVILSI